MKTSNRSRKNKSPPNKAAAPEEELKVEKLKEDQLLKALPRDLQWEILSDFLGTHVVRNGKLMRVMTGEIQSRILNSIPQRTNRIELGRNLHLNLKAIPQQFGKKKFFGYKSFDLPGVRSLSVVEDSNGNPSYRYINDTVGQDRVEINTPMNNDTVLEPYKKNNYPSYPFTDKKKGYTLKKSKKFNPTKPNPLFSQN